MEGEGETHIATVPAIATAARTRAMAASLQLSIVVSTSYPI